MSLFNSAKAANIGMTNSSSSSSGSDSPNSYKGPEIIETGGGGEIIGGQAGYFASVFNLMNGILGCGIVGLPILVMSIGKVGFTIGLMFVAAFALWTIDLLLQICVKYKTTVYEDLATLSFGRPGRIYTSFVIALSCFIAQGAFLYIVRDNIVGILQGLFLTSEMNETNMPWYLIETNSWKLTLLVIWGIVAPLTLPRQINFLGKSSGVAMIGMMIFAGMLIVLKYEVQYPIHKSDLAKDFLFTYNQEKAFLLQNRCVIENPELGIKEKIENVTVCGWSKSTQDFAKKLDYNFAFADANITTPTKDSISKLDEKFVSHNMVDAIPWFNASNIVSAFPTMIFAFQCHASALPIYSEQKVPTRSNFLKVAITAVFAVFSIYWTASISAAHTFYNVTWSQVMLPYIAMEQSDLFILIARITIVNCVTLSAPLLLYTGRKTLVMLFAKPRSIYLNEIKSTRNYIYKHIGWALVNLIAVSILVCSIESVDIIFGIGGAITANSIVVILPTAFYYKLMVLPELAEEKDQEVEGLKPSNERATGCSRNKRFDSFFSRNIYPFVTSAGLVLMLVMTGKVVLKAISK